MSEPNIDPDYERSYLFRAGIDQLESVYRIAVDAMAAQRAEYQAKIQRILDDDLYAEEMHARYQGGVLNPRDHMELLINQNRAALQPLCQSFLMALYHHWERMMISWMAKKDTTPTSKYEWLARHGVQFNRDKMEDLRHLMKVIKHEKGAELFKRRPDLFYRQNVASHENLSLRAKHVVEFFEAVRGAGPSTGGTVLFNTSWSEKDQRCGWA